MIKVGKQEDTISANANAGLGIALFIRLVTATVVCYPSPVVNFLFDYSIFIVSLVSDVLYVHGIICQTLTSLQSLRKYFLPGQSCLTVGTTID